MGAGQGMLQIPSRHAGNFVSSGKVHLNPFSWNKCSFAQHVYKLAHCGGRAEGEISNSFALPLVAALHSTWLITVGSL